MVEQISSEDAAQWCDQIYAGLPPLKFQPPANILKLAPQTVAALKSAHQWRVVMLGDSIVNDTYTSVFQALVKRDFPESDFNFIISVRGSTGCVFYQEPVNFGEYVRKHEPNLVMIGGIYNGMQSTDIDAIGRVIEMCREIDAEVILMSPAHAQEQRNTQLEPPKVDSIVYSQQKLLSEKLNVAFFNMTTPCFEYINASGKPLNYFNRDIVHNNDYGKQLIGRVLQCYFQTARYNY